MTETPTAWVSDRTWKARWEKIEELEGGGQGEVYRVRRRSDDRMGFLKSIKSRKDPERRARFFREAAAYESFGINGIPKLIESNAHLHADGDVIPFIVTEFIEGPTLEKWRMSQASVSIETAVIITSRLLDILEGCHELACVHRDVKPGNIILEDGAPARVCLLDFGISYHDLAELDFQTEHGQEVGNRFLRLPELSAGSRSKQDPRSDICFAAGILFYLLTGDHPDVLADSEGRLPHQRTEAVAKLRRVALSRLAWLLAIFDEAFAPLIGNRFADVPAMRKRMDKMMQDQPSNPSADEDLDALKEVLDTAASRQLTATASKINNALTTVQHVFNQVQQAIGGNLSISQTGWAVSGESGRSTWFWTRQGSTDRILSVTCEVVPSGNELLLRMSGETVSRVDLADPGIGDDFRNAVRAWLAARLRKVLLNPDDLSPEH